MEKEHFVSLVKNYTSLTSDEATELATLQLNYPYSQVIHNLSARAAQDNNLERKEQLLHVSAIYTTDRTVLKSIMTASRGERIAEPVIRKAEPKTIPIVQTETPLQTEAPVSMSAEPVKQEVKEIITNREQPPVNFTPAKTLSENAELSGDALLEDLRNEIEKLKTNRHNFETIVEELEKEQATEPKSHKKSTKKTVDTSDTLIEEIKTTKKKVAPEGKQKEQIEIIENFIKTKPSIAKNKPVAPLPVSDDLSEKSIVYGDNIVSETLVEILLKQGKKDKAIDILKKLIWKFPQKKAYFAARIEDLKN